MKSFLATLIGAALLVIVSMAWTTAARAAGRSGLLLVANKGERALGLIDPQTGRQVALVPENGVTGHEVIASPDGRTAYVPIYGDSGVGKAGLGRPASRGDRSRVADDQGHARLRTRRAAALPDHESA